MLKDYGYRRTANGEDTLPIMAWKMDASLDFNDDEMIIQVEKIHIERNSLKQIVFSVGKDEEKVKERIMKIVNDRRKLHNPFTGTGGTIYGKVSHVGKDFHQDVECGERVLVTTSATMIPLHLDKIKSIDLTYGSMEVEGYCIIFNSYNFVKGENPEYLESMLLGFEESPAIYHAYKLAKGCQNFLITGNNLIVALIYALLMKKVTGGNCNLTGMFYPDLDAPVDKEMLLQFYNQILDKIYIIDPEDIMAQGSKIINEQPDKFDFCINCSDISESEFIDVLALKEQGTLFYTNVMATYQNALFFSEGVKKNINIVGPLGYADGYEEFTVSFMKEINSTIKEFAEKLRTLEKVPIDNYRMLEYRESQNKMSAISDIYGMIYVSDEMKDMVTTIENVAKFDCSVLVTGETGVGKEKVSKLIHSLSKRKMGPCLVVNCGAIPATLMESEFFGYEKGAFTGANQSGKKGYFESAANGVLVLDEIGELELAMQSKLLRVLQEKEFYRVGGNTPIKTNVRIIAATNRDLKTMVALGEFREDLYYRLKVADVYVPPLRKRKDDIAPIAKHFIGIYNTRFAMHKYIEKDALILLENYDWPGNVRELENMVQRFMINSPGDVIGCAIVEQELLREVYIEPRVPFGEFSIEQENIGFSAKNRNQKSDFDHYSFDEYVQLKEKEFLKYNLKKYGTTRRTAEALGMTQSTIMRKKKKYAL